MNESLIGRSNKLNNLKNKFNKTSTMFTPPAITANGCCYTGLCEQNGEATKSCRTHVSTYKDYSSIKIEFCICSRNYWGYVYVLENTERSVFVPFIKKDVQKP